MNFRTVSIYEKDLDTLHSMHIPMCAEDFVIEYFERHGEMPLNDCVNYVAHFAKQGVKVRLK